MSFQSRIKNKIKKYIVGVVCVFSPKVASNIKYYFTFHKWIDYDDPEDFNQMLMKIKVENYGNNPIIKKCCDKYGVREYAKEHGVSEKNLPELLYVYENANEIDFDVLPEKFVLKSSHGYHFNFICTDKSKIDYEKTRKLLNKWQHTSFGYQTAEIQYLHPNSKIICEKFIEGENGHFPRDYKIYCFNGIPKVILVCSERDESLKRNMFDTKWKILDYFKEEYLGTEKVSKPKSLDNMLDIAKKVSKEFKFVRVDFYEYKGKAILGEMTFTPAACVSDCYNEKGRKELLEMFDD